MKPEYGSNRLLGITRSQGKMYEYSIPEESHINISAYNPSELYSLTIGLIGDLSYYVIEDNSEQIKLAKKNLQFSAQFFDSFLQSKLKDEHSDYLKLIGSAAYYLCDLPGSSKVLLNLLVYEDFNLECNEIDNVLYCVLGNQYHDFDEGKYTSQLNEILTLYQVFFETGNIGNIFDLLDELRVKIYEYGTDRELLFIDILYATIKNKYKNSSWVSLPIYSELDISLWDNIIRKDNFIKELWPAQHLLGTEGVYKGKSAVIQMPTSAGKTKSTELIIRSAFLSERADLAIIVAPFRALCNEIKNDMISAFDGEDIEVNEFTDVMQVDDIDDLAGILDEEDDVKKTILVSTPEKLYFILKQFPELVPKIGLLIYDEGHQFDSGVRGVTYELLLASLKTLITDNVQTILISAVIGNSQEINDWLNDDHGIVVGGSTLTPTYRTVAFTSWVDTLGQVKFVDPQNLDDDYFVPRVIDSQRLNLNSRERTPRLFPKKNDSNTIALYLGLKLVNEGSVAIFSGTKVSVLSMCKSIVDAYDRGLDMDKPLLSSDANEIARLGALYKRHFGEENQQTKSVALGILTHHANLPQGIKLSVEYALQQSLAKLVICTSTLAQGVNLPIRYLIITSVYQAGKRLKVRDFHNLIGRAGRAGKYTEGSIIFANNTLYDKKRNRQMVPGGSGEWKWNGIKELLNPLNSEASSSSLLRIFDDLHDSRGRIIFDVNLEFLLELLNNPDIGIVNREDVREQLFWKKTILNSIESYILTNLDADMNMLDIVKNTLAYNSVDDDKKDELIKLFKAIEINIIEKVPEAKRKVYAKSLFGIDDIKALEEWLNENYNDLLEIEDDEGLLVSLWAIISKNINNNTFKNYMPNDSLSLVISAWISGKSYYEIFEDVKFENIKIKTRKLTIEHIIDICEQGFSFDATMTLSSIIELLELKDESEEHEKLKKNLKFLQKQIKYGLDTSNKIMIYELGFSDRVVAQELALIVCNEEVCARAKIKRQLRRKYESVENILSEYPSYFEHIYKVLL